MGYYVYVLYVTDTGGSSSIKTIAMGGDRDQPTITDIKLSVEGESNE